MGLALWASVPTADAAPRRLFTEEEATLETRKVQGEAEGGRQLADLNLYYEVPLMPGTTAERVADVVAALNALDSVETAYAQPPAEPAMVNFGMDAALRGLLAAADIAPATPFYEGKPGLPQRGPRRRGCADAGGAPDAGGIVLSATIPPDVSVPQANPTLDDLQHDFDTWWMPPSALTALQAPATRPHAKTSLTSTQPTAETRNRLSAASSLHLFPGFQV